MSGTWIELSIITSQDAAEVISERLIEYGSQGTVFEDIPDHGGWCVVKAYYAPSIDIEVLQQQLRRYLENLQKLGIETGPGEVATKSIAQEDWSSNWKHYFKPLRIGEHFVIKPSWETFEASPDDVLIEIEPGMAFGTGLHESTRLCMQFLEHYAHPGDRVLDVGTGSGILSLAAARLGAEWVLGLDVDAEAVEIARENVAGNAARFDPSLNQRITLQVGSLDTIRVTEKFDCIVMNIRPNIILPLIPYAEAILQTGGALILAGILEQEGSDLIHEVRTYDLLVHDHQVEGEWIAYVLSHMHNASSTVTPDV
jgi:ribosomal protein L11 methyltransferase